ncbi:MAG: carbon monoxide dehydrogenase [Alphaproteobacteria bacterium]|nr:carbon monoxide dehydrogenase [Alphaproteobacteria bacterium]
MELTGSIRLDASRESVWAALNDPEVLRRAIPGCDSLSRLSPSEFTARVTTRIGPAKASFSGTVLLSEVDPLNSYMISGEGTGGAAGFAKGSAKVKLTDEGQATLLSYSVSASVGGKLAQIGGRLIEAAAQKLSQEFFHNFASIVVPPTVAAASPAPMPATDSAPAPRFGLAIPAAVLLAILLLLYRAAHP